MAELLILAFNTSNSDEAKDVFAYKLGHVIAAKPDGHKWGKQECLPKFYIIKIPKLEVKEAEKYLEGKPDVLSTSNSIIAIRKYKFDVENLSSEMKTSLEKEGIVTIENLEDFERYVVTG